jgi:hypothetical protein
MVMNANSDLIPSMLAPLSLPALLTQVGPGLSFALRLGTGSLGQVAGLHDRPRVISPSQMAFSPFRCPAGMSKRL